MKSQESKPQVALDSGQSVRTSDTTCALTRRGWYAKGNTPPCVGPGTATVEPFRKREDIDAIKSCLEKRPRDLVLFVVGIHFGLRGSDLLSLRWDDLLDAEGALRSFVAIIERKTGKLRRIAVQTNARVALKTWHALQKPPRDNYVFPSRKGSRLKIARLHQLVNEWAQRAGVDGNYGSHSLRKTFGYQLRQMGCGIEVIMKIYGHSSQSVTLRYLGIDQDETDQARLKLNL